MNQARSVVEISPRTSLYIPIARKPSHIPGDLDIDDNSLWTMSGVQCCAVESASLPSRLRATTTHNYSSLDEMSMALGIDENQKLAQLECSFQPHGAESGMANGASHHNHKVESIFLSPTAHPYNPTTKPLTCLESLRGSHLDELCVETGLQSSSLHR